MSRIRRNFISAQELVEMYHRKKTGEPAEAIGRSMGRTGWVVTQAQRMLDRYLESEGVPPRKNYRIAVGELKSNGVAKPQPAHEEKTMIAEPSASSAEGNLKRLEGAFMIFQQELVAVIEAEATRRSEEKLHRNRKN